MCSQGGKRPSAHCASSPTTDPIRPASAHDLELEICLTEVQNQKLALQLEVLRLPHADGNKDVNTKNAGSQPTSKRTHKKRTVLGHTNSPQVTFPLLIRAT